MQVGNIHSRLKEERERLGLSQKGCAEAAGVGLSTWRGWERSRAMPAEALGPLLPMGFDIGYVISGQRADAAGRQAASMTARQAVERVSAVMKHMKLDLEFSVEQIGSLVGYTIEQNANEEQVQEFIVSAYKVMGKKLPGEK